MISMRPTFVDRVFNGYKSVELRRTRPNVRRGDTVFIYCSAPVSALVGSFTVAEIITNEVDDLWSVVKEDAGVTREEFDVYFVGATTGYGIRLQRVIELDEPVPLESLRDDLRPFVPPQSFNYFRGKYPAIRQLLRYFISSDSTGLGITSVSA